MLVSDCARSPFSLYPLVLSPTAPRNRFFPAQERLKPAWADNSGTEAPSPYRSKGNTSSRLVLKEGLAEGQTSISTSNLHHIIPIYIRRLLQSTRIVVRQPLSLTAFLQTTLAALS